MIEQLYKMGEYFINKIWENIPAINRVDIPVRRVEQGEIRDLDSVREHKLYHVRSCLIKFIIPIFLPPYCTLAINCPIRAYNQSDVCLKDHWMFDDLMRY